MQISKVRIKNRWIILDHGDRDVVIGIAYKSYNQLENRWAWNVQSPMTGSIYGFKKRKYAIRCLVFAATSPPMYQWSDNENLELPEA